MKFIALSEVRIGIDFNNPSSEILVNHKIIAEQLEARPTISGVEGGFHTEDRVNNQIFDPRNNMFLKGNISTYGIKIILEFLKGQRIAFFKLAIIFSLDLKTNVSQMHIIF